VAPDARLGAVIGLQPYTRSMSDAALSRVATPTLLVLSEFDTTAPIATDGDRPWQLIPASPVWRLDLLATRTPRVERHGPVPRARRLDPRTCRRWWAAYVHDDGRPTMIGEHLRPWRDGLYLQLRTIWAFLDVTLGIDADRGRAEADELAATPGLILRRR